MPVLNRSRARTALVVLAVLAASPQAARADTKILVCTHDGIGTPPYGPTYTVELNEAERTATINFSAVTGQWPYPAHSRGPLPAVFDTKSITLDNNNDPGFFMHFSIDRITGVLLNYTSVGAPWDQAGPQNRVIFRFPCEVGRAKF
jgi:hypothetical protein